MKPHSRAQDQALTGEIIASKNFDSWITTGWRYFREEQLQLLQSHLSAKRFISE
jgi:hypothetical protein